MDAILRVSNIDQIDRNIVNQILERNGYAIIRGLFDVEQLNLSMEKFKQQFSQKNDSPTVGETPKDVQSNFQKVLIGGKTQSDDYLARFFRVFYNPIWDKNIYDMRDNFKTLIKVRNILMGVRENFAMSQVEEISGLWSACRLHQYPVGGAFMSMHRDYIVDGHMKERNLSFYQLMLNFTKRGDDFESGGAYVYNNGEKIDLEAIAEKGDVIVYSGASLHGVEDIDPHKTVNLNTINGRIVAFATLYHDKPEANKVSTLDDIVEYDPAST